MSSDEIDEGNSFTAVEPNFKYLMCPVIVGKDLRLQQSSKLRVPCSLPCSKFQGSSDLVCSSTILNLRGGMLFKLQQDLVLYSRGLEHKRDLEFELDDRRISNLCALSFQDSAKINKY